MTVRVVECERRFDAPAEAIWATVSDFASDWHPAIKTCSPCIAPDGSEGRVFEGVDGGMYRERLTWLSHADRVFRYVLTDGIPGVRAYDAEVRVVAVDGGASLTWKAAIDAPADSIDGIAEGTRVIFEQGFDWLAAGAPPPAKTDAAGAAAPAPIERGVVPGLSWLRAGAGQGGPLVLFLHGIGGNAENWRAQLEVLGGAHRVAALDLRGYGGSALGAAQTSVDDHCADILGVMQAEGAERIVLVGLSMGSWIATSFAMRYPARLAGLVLMGGCTGMSEASPEERAAFRAARAEPLAAGKTPADFAPTVVDMIAGPTASAEVRETLRASMAGIAVETYRDSLACFCSPTETFDFSRIACPVMMMTGEHDRLAPPEEIRSVAERIHAAMPKPDMRFEVIAGAGHVCNVEEPGVVLSLLSRFIERVSAQD